MHRGAHCSQEYTYYNLFAVRTEVLPLRVRSRFDKKARFRMHEAVRYNRNPQHLPANSSDKILGDLRGLLRDRGYLFFSADLMGCPG